MFPPRETDAVELVRSALDIGNRAEPRTIAALGAGIGADLGARWESGLAGRRDVFRAVRLIQFVVRRAARLADKELKRGQRSAEAPKARVLRSLMRKVEVALPTVRARVSFTLRDGNLGPEVEWMEWSAAKATEVAALALAALLSEEGALWRRLRTCPECGDYFLKQHKQKVCSPECAREVHKVKIAAWKRKNI